jgi:ribosomal protein S18 acetylase RimI-like enzyme
VAAGARPATDADLPALVSLYAGLLEEMTALKAVWHLADGLPEPIGDSFRGHLTDPRDTVYLGEYDGVPVGFLVWREDELLPQARGDSVATIRLIYTDPEARRVGVGEAMMGCFFEDAIERGLSLYDAVVPPGHRHAKNFFESNGFKARRIVMHREDRD